MRREPKERVTVEVAPETSKIEVVEDKPAPETYGTRLPPIPRAFKVTTTLGSTFNIRYDPWRMVDGIEFGKQRVIGYSRLISKNIDIQGMGAVPERNGHIRVDKPADKEDLAPEEMIARVEEISIASDIPT